MVRRKTNLTATAKITELWNALKGLKECKKDDRGKLYSEIFKILEYPEVENMEAFKQEAYLIKIANATFVAFTEKTDIALMSLGLLKGYEYRILKTGTERRLKYLKESPYLARGKGDKIPYDVADDDLKGTYENRLRKAEVRVFFSMADFMLQPKHYTKEYIDAVDGYIYNKQALFPEPSYKKIQAYNHLDVILNFLVMGRSISREKERASLNKDKEYEVIVKLPDKVVSAITVLFMTLCIFSVSQYKPQGAQKYSDYVAATEPPKKEDYVKTSLARRELPGTADDSVLTTGTGFRGFVHE